MAKAQMTAKARRMKRRRFGISDYCQRPRVLAVPLNARGMAISFAGERLAAFPGNTRNALL